MDGTSGTTVNWFESYRLRLTLAYFCWFIKHWIVWRYRRLGGWQKDKKMNGQNESSSRLLVPRYGQTPKLLDPTLPIMHSSSISSLDPPRLTMLTSSEIHVPLVCTTFCWKKKNAASNPKPRPWWHYNDIIRVIFWALTKILQNTRTIFNHFLRLSHTGI